MIKRHSITICAAALLALIATACGGSYQRTLPGYPHRPQATGAAPDVQALSRAVNRFYGAADMDDMDSMDIMDVLDRQSLILARVF